ncbi:MAG: hypothetical protein CME26_17365 [Gemmatimonadetes bacterium]|nr:hypothetical protein [Gemmatimonadota bacterium]
MTNFDSHIQRLRSAVCAADHTLCHPSTVEALSALRQHATDIEIRLRTPEYDRDEYLLNCDQDGCPVRAEFDVAALVPWVETSEGMILVNRWLAHFFGFRHRVIHLFLDHPDHSDCTFAQIRSLSKYNSPGRLDMPVGGHVTGIDDQLDSLAREVQEELGLSIERDLIDVRVVGTFNIVEDDDMADYIEVEHATVYRASLRTDTFQRLRFQPGEVGGLALIRTDELDRWIQERSEDVGGGMSESWKYYRDE